MKFRDDLYRTCCTPAPGPIHLALSMLPRFPPGLESEEPGFTLGNPGHRVDNIMISVTRRFERNRARFLEKIRKIRRDLQDLPKMSIFDKKSKKLKILCSKSQNFEKPQICGFRKKGLKIRKGPSKTAGFAENRKVWSHCYCYRYCHRQQCCQVL